MESIDLNLDNCIAVHTDIKKVKLKTFLKLRNVYYFTNYYSLKMY